MLSKAFDRKQTILNFSGNHKKNDLIVLEPKPPLIGCYLRNRCDTPEPYGNLFHQMFKVGCIGQSNVFGLRIFGLSIFSAQKYKRKITFSASLGHQNSLKTK